MKSGYWKPVRISEWTNRLEKVKTKRCTNKFSVVYRFFSRIDSKVRYVRYVGRSDDPFSRVKVHRNQIVIYGIHEQLGGRVTWVDFLYITGRGRFKESYEEECRQYHLYQPDLNKIHPAKKHSSPWKCPVWDCKYA